MGKKSLTDQEIQAFRRLRQWDYEIKSPWNECILRLNPRPPNGKTNRASCWVVDGHDTHTAQHLPDVRLQARLLFIAVYEKRQVLGPVVLEAAR